MGWIIKFDELVSNIEYCLIPYHPSFQLVKHIFYKLGTYHLCPLFTDTFNCVQCLCLPMYSLENLPYGTFSKSILVQLELIDAFERRSVAVIDDGDRLSSGASRRQIVHPLIVIHILRRKLPLSNIKAKFFGGEFLRGSFAFSCICGQVSIVVEFGKG